MIVDWQGKQYEVDFADITMRQGEAIEKASDMALGTWLDGITEGFDPNDRRFLPTLKIVYWLMLNQNGDDTPIDAVDFPMLAFARAFMKGLTGKDVPAAAPAPPDPTQLPGGSSETTGSPELSTPTGGTSSQPATPDLATARG